MTVDSSNGFRPPGNDVQAFIDLLNDVLAARSPTGAYISAGASVTFIDVGLFRSLTRTLQALDLDHVDLPKAVTGLIKALEVVTKEHVHSANSNTTDHVESFNTTQTYGGFEAATDDMEQDLQPPNHCKEQMHQVCILNLLKCSLNTVRQLCRMLKQ